MTRKKLIWFFSGMVLFDLIIPIPLLAIAGLYLVVKRPMSVLDSVRRVYADK